ncbi:LXG domain-containing protein [Caldibacillus lycopersici]|uniref:LXG domain-containing protein n=1 Tax=Perspicuibacillus lycopersici TaxID=1325689 RepID=A0AAE3ITA5_9BACI|nr:LXG domain-containing protein [Perspicuibacillus lycopersici]MCU9613233.1 LXG domain-containing protein [Perspicuibacillus lycopersici]
MKVLDVNNLFSSVDYTVSEIGKVQSQLTTVLKAVDGIISLEGSLDGKGGLAIRSFYTESHLPFLKFFFDLLEEYKQTLQNLKQAVSSYEPETSGYVKQDFLDGAAENGLNHAKNITDGLTDDANAVINSVSDIVSLPQLNQSELINQVQNGKRELTTTIDNLYTLDSKQTSALSSIHQDTLTMKNYISDIQSKFSTGAISIANYNGQTLQSIPAYHTILATQADATEEVEDPTGVSFNPMAAFDGPSDWVGMSTEAVAFYQLFGNVSDGFKIVKHTTPGGKLQYRVYGPETVGIGRPRNPANPRRTYKIYDADYIKNHGSNLKVNEYIRPGAGAVSALRSKAGWAGVAVETVMNAKENIDNGEPFRNIAVDAGVDVGVGAVSLAVGGAVTAAVVGTLGAPVLVGAAAGVLAGIVITSVLDGIEINGKSVSDHIKSGLRTVAGWFS